MALVSAAALVHRLGATLLQLNSAYQQHISLVHNHRDELAYLLSGLRELSVAVHAALLEGFQTSNESISRAVYSTLERVIRYFEGLRNHEYRCLASAHGSPGSTSAAALKTSSSFGQCSSHLQNCCAQLSQASQELQSYVHLNVSMASCALASGGQANRSQLPLPEQVISKLSELHSIASSLELKATAVGAADPHAVSKAVRRLARLVTGCPAEQMAALVKLAHMANKSSLNYNAVAAAGGIPLIVDLLGSSNMDVLDLAAGMLGTMAYASPVLQAAVAAAGGGDRLAQPLGSGHPAVLRLAARQQQHGGCIESSAEQAAMQQLEACFAHCHC